MSQLRMVSFDFQDCEVFRLLEPNSAGNISHLITPLPALADHRRRPDRRPLDRLPSPGRRAGSLLSLAGRVQSAHLPPGLSSRR
jgi:hypothetical protein